RLIEQFRIRLGDVKSAKCGGRPAQPGQQRGGRDSGFQARCRSHQDAPSLAGLAQAKRRPGRTASRRNTDGASTIRATYSAGRISRKNASQCASNATASANRKRPSRESGLVRGSEIIKKVKISSAPLCS